MSDSSKKPAPLPADGTESRVTMSESADERALPSSADDPRWDDLLARWDELPDDTFAALQAHPQASARLRRLQEAERFLAGDTCPEAEELYDFSRGPGYEPMEAARRGEIEDHLVHCYDCERLVESLETSPPLPIETTEEAEPSEPLAPVLPFSLERWLPMAAAAAVLALGFLVFRGGGVVDAGEAWPDYPLLRGASAEALNFPRDRVLAEGLVPGGGWSAEPLFELAPVEGATSYRVTVHQHTGDAFDTGKALLFIEGETPTLRGTGPLAIGHYTWEAWATVDGLERELGERDFEVSADESRTKALSSLSTLEQVHRLHKANLWTDARSVARKAPESPGRDDYLGLTPGR